MHDQVLRTYHELMQSLAELPADIAALQEALTAVRLQLGISEKMLKDIEADLRLTVEGKNAEERAARLAQTLQQHAVYQRWSAAADTERREAIRLQDKLDNLTRQYGAVCYQARLHAGLMTYLGSAGAPVAPGAPPLPTPPRDALTVDTYFAPKLTQFSTDAAVTVADAQLIGL
jgi:hypothetical protein